MSTRVLVIGADALDKDLVLRWTGDGTLPTFRKLLETATWGVTNSPPGLFVGAVWPSFWTATSPARHARYCFEQMRPGTYERARTRPTDSQEPAFWERLSRAGRRVAVIDVPKTYVSKGFNGVQVVDWGTHDADFDRGPHTWPESLADEIVSAYGRDEVGNCNAHGRDGRYQQLRDQLISRIERRGRMIRDVIARESWDCTIAVFSESHCVGHQCWHVHDAGHPRHDAAVATSIGDPIRDVYRALDTEIGRLLDSIDSDTDVIIFGSHGMRSHYDGTFLLDEMLRRIENPRARTAETAKTRRPLARRVWKRIPGPLRNSLRAFKEPAKVRFGIEGPAGRSCFPVPNNQVYGAIRVNLIGREPEGRVPSAELDSFCAALIENLKSFTNLDNGEPLVRGVMRVSEFYRGPNAAHLPDLIVEWNRDHPITRITSPGTGDIVGADAQTRTGDHSPLGFFFARGARTTPGPLAREFNVMDYGPTVAELLGVSLDHVDGRSFADIFGARNTPRAATA